MFIRNYKSKIEQCNAQFKSSEKKKHITITRNKANWNYQRSDDVATDILTEDDILTNDNIQKLFQKPFHLWIIFTRPNAQYFCVYPAPKR